MEQKGWGAVMKHKLAERRGRQIHLGSQRGGYVAPETAQGNKSQIKRRKISYQKATAIYTKSLNYLIKGQMLKLTYGNKYNIMLSTKDKPHQSIKENKQHKFETKT